MTPKSAFDFASLAERRIHVASIAGPAAPVLAWPTLERLARTAPRLARALVGYARAMEPTRLIAANDNDDVKDAELSVEFTHEIRPTPDELLAAADDDLVIALPQPGPWAMRVMDTRPALFCGDDLTIGRLVFRAGRLVEWGRTKRDVPLRPVERQRLPRGGKVTPAAEDAVRFLLPANENTPIAKGAWFVGGRTRPKGNTSRADIGDHAAEVELSRAADAGRMRDVLGDDAAIIDMAITDATAREIGETLGFTGKTAERWAMRRISAALEKIAA